MSNFTEIGSERPVTIYDSTHLTVSIIVAPKNVLDSPTSYSLVPATLSLQAKSGYAVNVSKLELKGLASGTDAGDFVQFWASTDTDTRPVDVSGVVTTDGQKIKLDWIWRSPKAPQNASTSAQIIVSHIEYSLAPLPAPASSGQATTVTEVDVLAPSAALRRPAL